MPEISGVIVARGPDYQGREYTGRFFVSRGFGEGPGWYVYQHQHEPVGSYRLVRLAARPDVPLRKLRLWNVRVQRGWRTKREAIRVADTLNLARLEREVAP